MERLARLCCSILQEPDPETKARLALSFSNQPMVVDHESAARIAQTIPEIPARPAAMKMVTPGNAPKRKWGSESGRLALLHAIAHIEVNAMDLAFDMLARFAFCTPIAPDWSADFCQDWLRVGKEEARHFLLLSDIMQKRGMRYGDLAVHGGMWDAATATNDRVDARLAIAPMVLEARGLDVTPSMIARLETAKDQEAAEILQTIYDEEIGHVAIGVNWFEQVCAILSLEPKYIFANWLQNGSPALCVHPLISKLGIKPAWQNLITSKADYAEPT